MPSIHVVTCRTEGCVCEDYTLTLVNPGALIVCGGCSTEITDIQPPLPVVVEEES